MQHLAARAAQLGFDLTPAQCAQFDQYAAELSAWNERFNLTTIVAPDQIETHHFLDSLSALPALAAIQQQELTTLLASRLTAIDVGSGPGLPGLALKLVWPGLQLTLLESTGKKVTFLQHLIRLWQLQDVVAVHGRAEELAVAPTWRQRFMLVMARAVAPLPVLVEYLLPLTQVNGWVMAYKGAAVQAEVEAAGQGIALLGGRLVATCPLQTPGLAEQRSLVVIRKVAPTPPGFPRAGGVIRKRPLGAPPAG